MDRLRAPPYGRSRQPGASVFRACDEVIDMKSYLYCMLWIVCLMSCGETDGGSGSGDDTDPASLSARDEPCETGGCAEGLACAPESCEGGPGGECSSWRCVDACEAVSDCTGTMCCVTFDFDAPSACMAQSVAVTSNAIYACP